MDDALIEAVYKREPLWNPDSDLHKNAMVLKKLWEEVAYELQRDVKTIKSRWKNMRAYFFKEHKKISEKPSNVDGTDNACTSWQYYEPLLFLKRSLNTEDESNFSVDNVDTKKMLYMNKIPLVRKLRLRSKIQDLILAELEAVENNT
ncbi:uncharacterized protein LOC134672162 [Cydia fagiglandana]|uniref:uncharacterized protein LOC134672162 n=1 Tax=Cydia fagiglandana TaxID=1458189 RepID=UPI002FEDE85C